MYRAPNDFKFIRGPKDVVIIIAIVAGILGWIYISARADYLWADKIIDHATSEGWELIVKQDNFGSLILPWTWIKNPVTGLWFIDKAVTQEIQPGIYQIRILRASYDYSKTETETYIEFVNIEKRETAFNAPGKKLSELRWFKFEPGTPIDQITDYVVKQTLNFEPSTLN